MPHRIEVHSTIPDTRAQVLQAKLTRLDYPIDDLICADVYTIDKPLSPQQLERCGQMLANPVTQRFLVDESVTDLDFTMAIELGYLPGVTDNVGQTAREMIADNLKITFAPDESVYSSRLLLIKGNLSSADARAIGAALTNKLIERVQCKDAASYRREKGMGLAIPKVTLTGTTEITIVDLDMADDELALLGKKGILDHLDEHGTPIRRGPLALDLASMQAIRSYFQKEQRSPTDAELETLAQTWSEHCKHTIFASELDEIADGLYKHYIKRATQVIREQKGANDFCYSVFTDNSGAIEFDQDYLITDKAETHNSPSALDPFGGAITGIVGVNRDTMGFGMGALPIMNRYGFCFADPRKTFNYFRGQDQTNPILQPRQIMDGVVAGVASGGNCSGIPTPQGFVTFDDRYCGKPLVFVGTVGLIPKRINDRKAYEKKALPGDKIVMAGGRVGKDGIHGATFSSETLTTGSPSTAVQIGDPITQKKMSDALIKEARDLGLYHAITDNGAGGLSSSIGEMARDTGGAEIDLDKVPLKYPGLAAWEIWISESQERMTLAVAPDKVDKLLALLQKRGVEATVIGEFNQSGRLKVNSYGKAVIDLDMDFMHDGQPRKTLTSQPWKPTLNEVPIDEPEDYDQTLTDLLTRPNLCGYEFISRQFDHLVQGSAVLGPLAGKGRLNTDASVIRPLPDRVKGIVASQGLCPSYSDLDTYAMAAGSIDTAVRNAIAAGANLDHLALMDNFCWCSSEDPERLDQLKQACRACFDTAVAYGTPFISGKDSMFNDFKGFDEYNQPVKISVPPTLLISALGVIDDVTKAISPEPKLPGDLVYLLGLTKNELGGSEYLAHRGEQATGQTYIGTQVPTVDTATAKIRYQTLYRAIQSQLFASAMAVGRGGLGIALARLAIAGQLGLEIDLGQVAQTAISRNDDLLFSESQSRLIVTISPKNQAAFERLFAGQICSRIGIVSGNERLTLTGMHGGTLINTSIATLTQSYHNTFAGY